MKYHDVIPISRPEAEEAFADGGEALVADALVRIAFHDPDEEWVEGHCLRFLDDGNPNIRGLAATCLGHLARIHGHVNLTLVLPALNELLDDPVAVVQGQANDALSDIEIFITAPQGE